AVDAHAHHEVLVLELVGGELGRPRALDPLLALGVQAHPAESPGEVVGGDRTEALTRVDVEDALPDVERIVLGLELLVVVEGHLAVDLPLPLGLGGTRGTSGTGGLGTGHAGETNHRQTSL